MAAVIFASKYFVMIIIMVYQTNTGHPASSIYMSAISTAHVVSNVDVVTCLKLCTNFQVFAHFALQTLTMKL